MPDVPHTVTPWRGRRRQVDRRVAHARRDEQPEVGQPVEQRRREQRALAHGDEDLGAGDPVGQRGLVGDVLGQRHELDVDGAPVGARLRHVLIVIQHHTTHDVPLGRPDSRSADREHDRDGCLPNGRNASTSWTGGSAAQPTETGAAP